MYKHASSAAPVADAIPSNVEFRAAQLDGVLCADVVIRGNLRNVGVLQSGR